MTVIAVTIEVDFTKIHRSQKCPEKKRELYRDGML